MGYYRKSDCEDPEVFTAGVTAVLSRYGLDVVAKVCDPRTGLPSTCKFLPTLAEVREACDREEGRIRRALEADQRREAQLARELEAQALRAAPGYDAEQARRKQVAQEWRDSIAAQTAAQNPDLINLADSRKVQDPARREAVSAIIMRELRAKAEREWSLPCVLSDAVRATVGLPPARVERREAAE